MQVRFVVPYGQRVWLRIYWPGCRDGRIHNAMAHLLDSDTPQSEPLCGVPDDHPDERWPTTCEDCGAPVPPTDQVLEWGSSEPAPAQRQVFRKTLYSTPDKAWIGMPRTGDCYYADWYSCEERGGRCIHGWTNCDGRHLIVRVPDPKERDGHWWDVHGRASNCTMRDETTHRCWVLHGTPEAGNLHVDKAGHTCGAGAGSIDTGRWHGFLHGNALVLS